MSSMSCTPESCSVSCATTLNALSAFTSSATPASVEPWCALPRGLREVSLLNHREPLGFHPALVGMGVEKGGELRRVDEISPPLQKKGNEAPNYKSCKITYLYTKHYIPPRNNHLAIVSFETSPHPDFRSSAASNTWAAWSPANPTVPAAILRSFAIRNLLGQKPRDLDILAKSKPSAGLAVRGGGRFLACPKTSAPTLARARRHARTRRTGGGCLRKGTC